MWPPDTIPLKLAKRPFFAGIDVGGTNVKLGLVDDLGQTLASSSFPTCPQEGPERGVERMADALRKLAQSVEIPLVEIAKIGLATPGTMDIPAGMLLEPHNLPGWSQFPIRDQLAERSGLPVTFANDANAAGFGEYWRGGGAPLSSMVFITLGTGVGGGILIDGHCLEGAHSCGGELGHIIIDCRDDARLCPCGKTGHLEAYAGGLGLVARAREALQSAASGSLAAKVRSGENLTPLLIAEQAAAGDPLALALVMDTAKYLGIGIASLLHTVDPAGFVLGGAIDFGGNHTPLGRSFLARVRQEVLERGLPAATGQLSIEFARLGSAAGFIGAAGLARAESLRTA